LFSATTDINYLNDGSARIDINYLNDESATTDINNLIDGGVVFRKVILQLPTFLFVSMDRSAYLS
jgi:hypothetical protein